MGVLPGRPFKSLRQFVFRNIFYIEHIGEYERSVRLQKSTYSSMKTAPLLKGLRCGVTETVTVRTHNTREGIIAQRGH